MYIPVMVRVMVFSLLCCLVMPSIARTDTIELIVPFGPGGPTDQIARVILTTLPTNQYHIVNRPGASGRIAVRSMLGRSSMMMAVTPTIFVTNKLMFTDLEYDTEKDLEMLAVVAVMPNLLVCHRGTGITTIKDLLRTTRSLNFAASGLGANDHIAAMLLLQQWVNRHEIVHYNQGGTNSLIDLLSGVTDCMFANYPLVKPYLDDPRLNVIMSSEHLGLAVPIWQQQFGFPYPFRSQTAVIVSRQIDQTIKHRIRSDLTIAMSSVALAQKIADMGFVPILKVDSRSINEAAAINQRLTDFITRSQMRLK